MDILSREDLHEAISDAATPSHEATESSPPIAHIELPNNDAAAHANSDPDGLIPFPELSWSDQDEVLHSSENQLYASGNEATPEALHIEYVHPLREHGRAAVAPPHHLNPGEYTRQLAGNRGRKTYDWYRYLLRLEDFENSIHTRRNASHLFDGVDCRNFKYEELAEDGNIFQTPTDTSFDPKLILKILPVIEGGSVSETRYLLGYDIGEQAFFVKAFEKLPDDLSDLCVVWDEAMVLYRFSFSALLEILVDGPKTVNGKQLVSVLSGSLYCEIPYHRDDPGMEWIIVLVCTQWYADFAQYLLWARNTTEIFSLKSELAEMLLQWRGTLMRVTHRHLAGNESMGSGLNSAVAFDICGIFRQAYDLKREDLALSGQADLQPIFPLISGPTSRDRSHGRLHSDHTRAEDFASTEQLPNITLATPLQEQVKYLSAFVERFPFMDTMLMRIRMSSLLEKIGESIEDFEM